VWISTIRNKRIEFNSHQDYAHFLGPGRRTKRGETDKVVVLQCKLAPKRPTPKLFSPNLLPTLPTLSTGPRPTCQWRPHNRVWIVCM
jgi:hypothetical protein